MEKPAGIFKTEKGTKIIFAAGIALIVIIFLFSLSDNGGKTVDPAADSAVLSKTSEIDEYEQRLEERLAEIIKAIEGTGEVHIMITLERTEENVYSNRETSVAATITPTVRGALVICEGSDNVIVRQKVTDAVCKVLGISAARVCVTN